MPLACKGRETEVMAIVGHLFRAAKCGLPMEEIEQVEVEQNSGFQACAHAQPGGKRQVLLVDKETLDAEGLNPGVIRENITTEGLNVNGLDVGQSISIGEVQLEVSAVCTPCNQLEKIRTGLRRELWGRRGMLCRVVKGGPIRRGDRIDKIS